MSLLRKQILNKDSQHQSAELRIICINISVIIVDDKEWNVYNFILLIAEMSFVFFDQFIQFSIHMLYNYLTTMMEGLSNKSFFEQDNSEGFTRLEIQIPKISSIFVPSDTMFLNGGQTQDGFQIKHFQVFMSLSSNSDECTSISDLCTLTDQNSQKIKEQIHKPIQRTQSFEEKKRIYSSALIRYIADKQPIFGLSRRYFRSKRRQADEASELEAIYKVMVEHLSYKIANKQAVKRFDQELYDIFIKKFKKDQKCLNSIDKTQSALLNLIQNMNNHQDSRDALNYYIKRYNQNRNQARFLDRLIKREKQYKISRTMP